MAFVPCELILEPRMGKAGKKAVHNTVPAGDVEEPNSKRARVSAGSSILKCDCCFALSSDHSRACLTPCMKSTQGKVAISDTVALNFLDTCFLVGRGSSVALERPDKMKAISQRLGLRPLSGSEVGPHTKHAGVQIPIGTKCEQCFNIWRTSFSHKEWDVWCKEVIEDAKAQKQLEAARKNYPLLPCDKELKPAFVDVRQAERMMVSRSYMALSERELRKLLNEQRLDKATLATLPVVSCTMEDGHSKELLYLFVNPNQPHRLVTLSSEHMAELQTQMMSPNSQNFEGQGEEMWLREHHQHLLRSGMSTALAKTNVMSLDEFVEKRLRARQEQAQAEQTGPESISDSEGELQGPAAAEIKRLRSSSQLSLGSTSGKKAAKKNPVAGSASVFGDDDKAQTEDMSSSMPDQGHRSWDERSSTQL